MINCIAIYCDKLIYRSHVCRSMTARQDDRKIKLQMLKDDKLKPQQKADFYYKMAKILERELSRLDELSMLLEATPDSYLEKIDFTEIATSAMKLTEILIQKAKPATIAQELTDGSLQAERKYTVELGNALPGLKKATIDLSITYKPTQEERRFYRRLREHQIETMPANVTLGDYSLKEFMNDILPAIKSKDPNLKIRNDGISGYKPSEEFIKGTHKADPALFDAIRRITNELGTNSDAKVVAYEEEPPK